MEPRDTNTRDTQVRPGEHAECIAERQELERELAQHARQHDAVARLGQIALRERHLSLDVIAEGVESESQLRQLRALGCAQVQGYLLCHPQPAEEIGEFLDGRLRGSVEVALAGQPAG
jgi:EAL domain-containing protein (putative c-di-GMP-specific phosphodiesterase class I)